MTSFALSTVAEEDQAAQFFQSAHPAAPPQTPRALHSVLPLPPSLAQAPPPQQQQQRRLMAIRRGLGAMRGATTAMGRKQQKRPGQFPPFALFSQVQLKKDVVSSILLVLAMHLVVQY